MAAKTEAYTCSDSAQDVNPWYHSTLNGNENSTDGDHDSLFDESSRVNFDLDSLFEDLPSESFDESLALSELDFSPNVINPLQHNVNASDLNDLLDLVTAANNQPKEHDERNISFLLRADLSRPSTLAKSQAGLTLPSLPPRPPRAIATSEFGAPRDVSRPSLPVTPTPGLSTIRHTSPGLTLPLTFSKTIGPGNTCSDGDSNFSIPHFEENNRPLSLGTFASAGSTKSMVSPSQDDTPNRQEMIASTSTSSNDPASSLTTSPSGNFFSSNPSSLELSCYGFLGTLSNARSTPEVSSMTNSSLNMKRSCSPAQPKTAENPEKRRRKKAKTAPVSARPKLFGQPSSDTIRHTLQLGERSFVFMSEELKMFILDPDHVERYDAAVFVKTSLKFDEQMQHDAKLQGYATNLLDSGLGEKWWGPKSEGYADRQLKWPERRIDLIFILPKLFIRVCRAQKTLEARAQPQSNISRAIEKAENIAAEARRQVMKDRERVGITDDVECHICFILADNPSSSVRRKIIVKAASYSKHLDLVNFIVKLIDRKYLLVGFSVMGPLGSVKINTQADWEAIVEVIRATPCMASVAICTAEITSMEGLSKQQGMDQNAMLEPEKVRDVIVLD